MDVLIVEPDSSTILDLKATLEDLGHTVADVASNGEEAVQKAKNKPDLVLIDIKLKGRMSSADAANMIKDNYKIPVIFMTIFIKNCLIKSLGLPEDAIVLSKPIKHDHLEYGISRALSE